MKEKLRSKMGTLDPTRKSAIISHMNEDHADACLLYARHFADKQQAMNAEMIDVSMSQITLRIEGEVLYDRFPTSCTRRGRHSIPSCGNGQIS